MSIEYPIKGNLNRQFKITSPFGPRVHPISGRQSNHNGVDLVRKDGKHNEPILAPEAGKILAARKSTHPTGGYGYYVKMQGKSGVVHLMAHMVKNSFRVSKGDVVEQGDILGLMGTTGNSTGVHLHWEVRVKGKFVDPIKWIGANGEPDLPNNFAAWTKRKPNNSASVHIKNAPKGSKVRIRHNGVSVFVKTVRRPADAGLGKTITFEEGKNIIEIFVDGLRVKRVAYTKKSNSGGAVVPPKDNSGLGAITEPATYVKSEILHTVKPGDNLTKIAKKYGSTVPKLKKYNNLANANLIIIGQVIKIPQE